METYYFNKEVFVDAVAFLGGNTHAPEPRHMWVDDEEVTITATLRTESAELLEVTDGWSAYRLQLDPVHYAWKLLRRRPLEHVV